MNTGEEFAIALPSVEDLANPLHSFLLDNAFADTPSWTDEVARALAEPVLAGRLPGLVVCGRQFDGTREYLCDQVWSREAADDDWKTYEGLALVMECEWNEARDERLIDFCKVLDVSAERRLFVGQVVEGGLDEAVAEMDVLVQGHRYLPEQAAIGVVLAECDGDGVLSCILRKGHSPIRLREPGA